MFGYCLADQKERTRLLLRVPLFLLLPPLSPLPLNRDTVEGLFLLENKLGVLLLLEVCRLKKRGVVGSAMMRFFIGNCARWARTHDIEDRGV
jgi:hypothetical protein